MNKELYVTTTPHETKVALVEDDQLAEIYFERENEYTLAGSIYKGRVTRVLPGMQSAFVDIGLDRDAFLYVSDFLELQDEDEDGEFADVKVTGSTLANANGMILAEPQADESEDAIEAMPEEPAAEAAAPARENREQGEGRFRGRRRRRGRRGGRERTPEQGTAEAAPQAAAPDETEDDFEESEAPAAVEPPRKRELRGFEPRGLVVHGLNRVDQAEDPEEFIEAEEEDEQAPAASASAPAAVYSPMVLPGESISKYNRADGEAPPAPVDSAPADESYGRDRDRGRGGDRFGRGGGGRSGGRDRDRGRGRDREREPREPREFERTVLPENYTPIVLPGESISKYRGVEPVKSYEEPVTPVAVEVLPEPEPKFTAAAYEPVAEPPVAEAPVAETAQPTQAVAEPESSLNEPSQTVEHQPAEREDEEPLTSASYSVASKPPAMTQRPTVEVEEEDDTTEEVELTQEEMQAPMMGESAAAMPTVFVHPHTQQPEDVFTEAHAPEVHHQAVEAVPEPQAEVRPEAQPEAQQAELRIEARTEPPAETTPVAAVVEEQPQEPKPEGRSGRRTWRDRVAKMFGAPEEHSESREEPEAQRVAATAVEPEPQPAPVAQVVAEPQPLQAEPQRPAHSAPPHTDDGYTPHQPGSFVIEGGHVEHEELDEEEAEMPALAAHHDRYEESEEELPDEENGSHLTAAVRESEEEGELDDEEYDFGAEEFEESELLAGAVEEEDEEEDEGEDEGEEGEEVEPVAGAEPGRQQRPERTDRRERRGRRGAPPQRGGGRMRPRQQSGRGMPLISELLKEGQEILVQIAKEPIGKKGARITSHIALPGRFLVYMPTVNHIGVSRKISSDEERQRLKRIVSSERENGHGGFIVRTAAANIKEDELRADIRFLKHLWTEIRTRAESGKSPALIYHDLNLVERILRDQVTQDFSQIWVDNESEYERIVRFASRFQPNLVRRIKLYTKEAPLFEQFGLNEEINKSLKAKVWLKSGGYIVINQTEALVAIDINTGKYVGKTARLEDTIVKTNIDAVKEIVRQVRLRDLGGIIIVDFIDMDERKNRQKVMMALEEAMKADRAPSKILQFNDFGLVAITRKRVKQSLERTLGTPCPYCESTGFVKSVQTVANEIYVEMRKMRKHIQSKEVVLRVNPEVAKELKAGNGKWLQEMEELIGHPVLIKGDASLHQEQFDMNY